MLLISLPLVLACTTNLVPPTDLFNSDFTTCQDCIYPIAITREPGNYVTSTASIEGGDYEYSFNSLTAAPWAVNVTLSFVIPCYWGHSWSGCQEIGTGASYSNCNNPETCTAYVKNLSSGTWSSPFAYNAQQPFWVVITAHVHNQSLPVQIDICLSKKAVKTKTKVGLDLLLAILLPTLFGLIALAACILWCYSCTKPPLASQEGQAYKPINE